MAVARGARRSAHGISLNGIKLRLAGPAKSSASSGLTSVAAQSSDTPVVYDGFYKGALYSRNGPRGSYAYGDPAYCRTRGMVLPPGKIEQVDLPANVRAYAVGDVSHAPIDGMDWSYLDDRADFFFTAGPYIVKIPSGSGVPVDVYYAGAGQQFVSVKMFMNSVPARQMYFGVYGGYNMVRYDGTGFTNRDDSGRAPGDPGADPVYRGILATTYLEPGGDLAPVGGAIAAGVPNDFIIGNVPADTNTFRICPRGQDPMVDASWGAARRTGPEGYGIEHIIEAARHFWPMTRTGIYECDELGHASNISPTWKNSTDPGNGITGLYHDGYVLGSHASGLHAINVAGQVERQDSPEIATPGYYTGNETEILGRITASHTYGGAIYVNVYNGRDSWIMTGYTRKSLGSLGDGPGPILWHGAEAHFPGVAITMIRSSTAGPSTGGYPIMYYGGVLSDGSLTPVLYRQWLTKAGDPLQDLLYGTGLQAGGFKFHDRARIYLGANDWSVPTASKSVWVYSIAAKGLEGGNLLEVLAASNNNVSDASAYESQVSGVTGEHIVDVFPRTIQSGSEIGTAIELTNRNSNVPPIPPQLLAVAVQSEINVNLWREVTYTVEFGRFRTNERGGTDRRSAQNDYEATWRLQMEGPVELRNENGRRALVKVLNGSWQDLSEPDPSTVTQVVRASFTLRILESEFRWDVGRQFDLDKNWDAMDVLG